MIKDKTILVSVDKVDQAFRAGDEIVQPLKQVSFTINSGSFNIIYGPSGSGKSTLLNVLTGLQKPTRGTVLFEGQNVYDLTPNELAHFRAKRVGIVYQNNYWVKSLTVLENVSMSLYFVGFNRPAAAKLALAALERVGMAAYAKKYPALLSGGEQQRVAMARAIANDPLFIIADEPTGSLDSKNGDMIMNLLRQCQEEFKSTVILVTHNMEYLPLADNLLHIEDGHVETMKHENIRLTTDALIAGMKARIDSLARSKANASH